MYEKRLQSISATHDHNMEVAKASQQELLEQKDEEKKSLCLAHEVDMKRAASTLEAAKSKLSKELREVTNRLERTLQEQELTHTEEKTHLIAEHAEAMRISEASLSKLRLKYEKSEADLKRLSRA